jgi:hypothetical protein
VVGGLQAEHREQLPLDRVRDLGYRDLGGVLRQAAAAACAAEALNEAGLVQGPELLFEEPDGICWALAISRAGTSEPLSRRSDSSIIARIAYSSFWEIFSMTGSFPASV